MSAQQGSRWSIGSTRALLHAVVLILAHLVLVFGIGALAGRTLLGGASFFAAAPGSFAVLAITAAIELGVIIAFGLCRVGRIGLRELGWRWPVRRRELALGVLGALGCAALVLGLVQLFFGETAPTLATIAGFRPAQRLLFVLMGLFAGFTEETLFRGYLQPTLEARLGRRAGLAVTALIFAAYHLNLRPVALLGKLGFGLIYGGLRQATGGLWAPAVAHAVLWAMLGSV